MHFETSEIILYTHKEKDKVKIDDLKSAQTLQLYMYYLMGCRSIQLNAEYDFKNKIKKIGFFNPRLSKV